MINHPRYRFIQAGKSSRVVSCGLIVLGALTMVVMPTGQAFAQAPASEPTDTRVVTAAKKGDVRKAA